MDKVYKSKIDLGLVIPLVFSFIVIESLMIGKGVWPGAALVGVVILFIGYMFNDTYYKVTDDGVLKVRSGFLVNRKIDIRKIKSVTPTNSMLSAPALSMDRLKIVYDERSEVVISPKDKQEFVGDLKKWNPGIATE